MSDPITFFSRHYPLQSIGKAKQEILLNKTALVIGVGGLGNHIANLATSLGIGKIKLVDFDMVEGSNIARQFLFTLDDIGKSKAEVAKEKLSQRNPHIEIEYFVQRVDALNIGILTENVDIIIDALDSFSTRKIVFKSAFEKRIPYIFAGAVGDSGNIMSFLHEENSPCLFCVVGNMVDSEDMRCEVRGINPIVLQLVTAYQMNEVLRVLTGDTPLHADNMLLITLESEPERVYIKKNPGCFFCSGQDVLDQGKLGELTRGLRKIGNYGTALVTSLCGRGTYIFDPKWELSWEFTEVLKQIQKSYVVKAWGEQYITFNKDDKEVSLISSGTATIRGVSSVNEAINMILLIYDEQGI